MPEGVSPDTCKANMAGLQRGIDHNATEIGRVDRTSEKRLDAHAQDLDRLMELMAKTEQIVAGLTSAQVQHAQRLATLENKGGKRWEKIVETALVAIVSAVMGAVLAGVLPR